MLTITITEDEAQYLLNAMNTHVKAHGLQVATAGVVLLAKLQAANETPEEPPKQSTEEDPPEEQPTEDPGAP